MSSPDVPNRPAAPLLPEEEVRNLDSLRRKRLRGATLLTGKSRPTMGATLIGGAGSVPSPGSAS